MNELIECGAKVNRVNDKGFAPLHFTASSRHGALCLELLVCNGADVNIEVQRKNTTQNRNRKTEIAAPFCFLEEWKRMQQSRITLLVLNVSLLLLRTLSIFIQQLIEMY